MELGVILNFIKVKDDLTELVNMSVAVDQWVGFVSKLF